MTAALRDTALAYAADDLPVFPLFEPIGNACACGRADCSSPAKHPRTLHGLKDAITDADVIREWWRRWPTANIGVRTGTPGGLLVIDLDTTAAEVRFAQLAGLPAGARADLTAFGALVVRTGRGHQLWYRAPSDTTIANSAGKLGPGIDVRGTGGYTVAPPSRHITGCRYTFIGGRFDPPPARLLDALDIPARTEQPEPRRPVAAVASLSAARRFGAAVLRARCDAVRAAPQGERNYALLRAATTVGGYIATGAIDEEEARAALTAADNRPNEKPMPKATARTIDSGFKRGHELPLYVPDLVAELLAARSEEELDRIARHGHA